MLHATSANEVYLQLDVLMEKEWVVYSKPCPAKTRTVVDYLGRYSHRIAISDQRIGSIDNGQMCFSTKDYRANGTRQNTILSTDEFIRRYLLHVLPKGLMRIHHYGFLANRCRKKKLIYLRKAIAGCVVVETSKESADALAKPMYLLCKQGQLQSLYDLLPKRLNEA